jgi:hypothetical protein
MRGGLVSNLPDDVTPAARQLLELLALEISEELLHPNENGQRCDPRAVPDEAQMYNSKCILPQGVSDRKLWRTGETRQRRNLIAATGGASASGDVGLSAGDVAQSSALQAR